MTAPLARLDEVTLKYGSKVVLKNCTLDVVEGAITCLIGLSGAGKSTVLRLLNGLRQPDAGRVIVRGVDLATLRRRQMIEFRRKIGFAFQFAALFDSLTVGENVALPLREHTKMSAKEIDRAVIESLDAVGLADARDRMPSELSGGMLKRAGFARAVVTNPDLVLYDEPTTGTRPDHHARADRHDQTAARRARRNGRRGLARPRQHLRDGRLCGDAFRGCHHRVWNRG